MAANSGNPNRSDVFTETTRKSVRESRTASRYPPAQLLRQTARRGWLPEKAVPTGSRDSGRSSRSSPVLQGSQRRAAEIEHCNASREEVLQLQILHPSSQNPAIYGMKMRLLITPPPGLFLDRSHHQHSPGAEGGLSMPVRLKAPVTHRLVILYF